MSCDVLGQLLHGVQHVVARREHARDLGGLAPRSVSPLGIGLGSASRVSPV
jgi:hypothetical protein